MELLRKLADSQQHDSFATRLRRDRFGLFHSLMANVPRPCTILDVGGTELFWETMGFVMEADVHVVLLDVNVQETTYAGFTSVVGDARDMLDIADQQFDVVFSNSVIEHVGDFEQQRRMAREIQRVGRRYFIQTPNRYFPVEPHFLFPGFQFLPFSVRVALVRRLDLGWYARGRIRDRAAAEETVRSIQLLSKGQLHTLFPHAVIYTEKFLGLSKSFVAYGGWERD